MANERRFFFQGDDTAYIRHLESRVSELEQFQRWSNDHEQQRATYISSFCENCERNIQAATSVTTKPTRRPALELQQHPTSLTNSVTALRVDNLDQGTPAGSTQTRSNQGPNDKSTTDGLIRFVPWNPVAEAQKMPRNTTHEPTKYRSSMRLRLESLIDIVSKLPMSEKWRLRYSKRRTHWKNFCGLEISLRVLPVEQPTSLSSGAILSTPIPASTPTPTPTPTPTFPCTPTPAASLTALSTLTPTPMETLLADYINSLESTENAERNSACFRKLVLCSACVVALETTHVELKEDVYKVMRRIFESGACIERLQALGRGAKWINKAISALSGTEWALRSWDIPFLVANSLDCYLRFSGCSFQPEELRDGVEKVLSQNSDIKHYLKGCPNSSEAAPIPLIVETMLKRTVSLEKICHHLGCDFARLNQLRYEASIEYSRPNKKRKKSPPELYSDKCSASNPAANEESTLHVQGAGLTCADKDNGRLSVHISYSSPVQTSPAISLNSCLGVPLETSTNTMTSAHLSTQGQINHASGRYNQGRVPANVANKETVDYSARAISNAQDTVSGEVGVAELPRPHSHTLEEMGVINSGGAYVPYMTLVEESLTGLPGPHFPTLEEMSLINSEDKNNQDISLGPSGSTLPGPHFPTLEEMGLINAEGAYVPDMTLMEESMTGLPGPHFPTLEEMSFANSEDGYNPDITLGTSDSKLPGPHFPTFDEMDLMNSEGGYASGMCN